MKTDFSLGASGLLPVLCALVMSVASGQGADRVALVIGNNDYQHANPLTNPVRDARAVAEALGRLGFEVTRLENSTVEQFYEGIEKLKSSAGGAKVGLVYFAGHGVEVEGKNYLLPVDADLSSAAQLRTQAVALDTVLADLGAARLPAKMVILDCCRNNPLTRSWMGTRSAGSGLAEVKDTVLPDATMVMFSAGPGQVAADGAGGNSPFTAALVARLQQPGQSLFDAFLGTSDDVLAATGRKQEPWVKFDGAGRVFRETVFVPGAGGMAPAPAPPPVTPAAPVVDLLATVSKTAPFSNSLGMKFVPAGTPGVLFSVWETRVKDFTAFVEDSGHDAISNTTFGAPANTLEKTADGKGVELAQKGGSWQDPRFPTKQTGEHPVVCVSYLDAEAFCAWLTKKDRASGKIPATVSYRLPTDAEWSRACGSSTYPWGESYPPKSNDGNYSSKEAMVGLLEGYWNNLSKAGRRDSAARTAAVGMFDENRFGLCDMGGNVWEWCSTWYTADLNDAESKAAFPALKDDKGGKEYQVLRGSSSSDYVESYLRSSFRKIEDPRYRYVNFGFRCVLVVAGG